ncbi:MAG: heparan-alpha-glucosaminide N-acetyltransferase, partial [Acutalibacteraceae bacterium]
MNTLSRPSAQHPAPSKERLVLLDELRGFAVCCMVFYHGFYSMAALFGLPLGETLLRFFRPAEPWFAGLFILISGICCNFSHSNAQRGGKLLLVALAITGVTMWVVPEEQIIFGILHFLSVSMLLYAALAPICRRVPVAVGLLVQVFLYLGFRTVSGGTIFFGIKLPDSLYATDWLSPLGLHSTAFHSSDYFPLLPWVFVFFFGAFLGRLAANGQFPRFFYPSRIPFFALVGRHALLIYVVH